ncbi:unnamed protein product [Somion occarium]|uniref:Uncharacterized protein n=1 Tax=Somion occarium TaxID=3059160 RepID=A0ABP1CR87_9APHY
MAALYLHNALFANDPPQTPSLAHRASSSRTPHDRHLSSQSLVTLRTTTSEHSHPSEPLLHGAYSESSGGHELLTRHPGYPNPPIPGLDPTLESAALGQRERRRQWELAIRKRLRYLRWGKRSLLLLIGAWATYNTVRYFVALRTFTSHDRHIILLTLGSVSALSTALVLISLSLSAFATYLGWKESNYRHLYNIIQSFLGHSAAFFLLGPAVVNLVFIVIWRSSSSEPADTVQGRCTWDIDALWSGSTSLCDPNRATPWGFWLVGAIVRLVLTVAVTLAYLLLSRKYSMTRKPSRRRRRYSRPQSISESTTDTLTSSPSLSFRRMLSSSHSPVSISRAGRQLSYSTEVSVDTYENGGASSSGDHQRLRRSRSQIRSQSSYIPSPPLSPPISRDGHPTTLRFADEETRDSPESSEEGETGSSQADRLWYSSSFREVPGPYAFVSMPSNYAQPRASVEPANFPQDEDLTTFAYQFRNLVDQVTRETEAGIEMAANDHPGGYMLGRAASPPTTPRPPAHEDRDYFPYMGHIIQRMPTIESLGSREVTSLATSSTRGDRSVHSLSRPPTRSNTLSMASDSNPPSRSNSLTASVILSPAEGPTNVGVSELGEVTRPPGSGAQSNGRTRSRSVASYYTAVSKLDCDPGA